MKRVFLTTIVLLAAGAAAWLFFPNSPATQQRDVSVASRGQASAGAEGGERGQRGRGAGGGGIQVVLAPVQKTRVDQTYEALGTANANEAIVVTSKVTGTVRAINFKDGQVVPKGHVLIELDSRELKATLAAAVADAKTARQNYDRAAQLLASGSAAKARVDDLLAARDATEARAEAARARLADYSLTAPFAGRLGLRRISVGTLVSSNMMITTLDDVSVMKLDFSIPETMLSRVKPGNVVTAHAEALPGKVFEGIVRTADSRIDPVTRAVEIRADLPNPDGILQPGMLLAVTLTLNQRDDALVIPEEALMPEGVKQFVYLAVDGKAVKREIVIGERRRGTVEVREGLAETDQVIVGGLMRIRDGATVRALRGGGLDGGESRGEGRGEGGTRRNRQAAGLGEGS